MATVQITQEYIIINLDKIEEDVFSNSDKQKIVFLNRHVAGFNLNYTARTITFYFSVYGMNEYIVDFDRGGVDTRIARERFEEAAKVLGG